MVQIIRLYILRLAYVQQFISHFVYTQKSSSAKVLGQAIPEAGTKVKRVVVAVRGDEYIGIQDEL